MKNWLFLFLAQKRYFWRLKSLFSRTSSLVSRFNFRISYGVREEKSKLTSLRDLFRITEYQLVFSVLIAASLQFLDPYLNPLYMQFSIQVPSSEDYLTLLATVSGIGGVFIGLYYTAVSSIGGAIYSKVPNNIRDLLVHDRIGIVYMRYLAFLTFLSLCLISFRLLGYPRIVLAVPLITLMAGIGIIAFVKLGTRAFYLFDPTKLSHYVIEELDNWIRLVSIGSKQWNIPTFQSHAKTQSLSAINTLDTLSDISESQKHLSGTPFVEFTCMIVSFLMRYQNKKNMIPFSSVWYEEQFHHRDWYQTEDFIVSIAHETGTIINPKQITNKYWIEDKLLLIVLKCVKINIKHSNLNHLMEIFAYIDAYLKILAQQGEVLRAFDIVEQLGDAVLVNIPEIKLTTHQVSERLENLSMIERLASLQITILLSYELSINEHTKDFLSKKLNKIRWKYAPDLYKHGFPNYLLERLEWLRPRLLFELFAEDKIISPLWYQAELLAQVEAERLAENADCIINTSSNLFDQWFKKYNEKKHIWTSAVILSREWEYLNKNSKLFSNVAKVSVDISSNRNIEGLPWVEIDISNYTDQIVKRQDDVIQKMTDLLPILILAKRPIEFPDYAGQFMHTLGESVLEAFCDGNIKAVKAIFPSYFLSCWLKEEALVKKIGFEDWRSQQELKVAVAPLIDLLEISGFAKVLSDYHNAPELWSVVVNSWDQQFSKGHGQKLMKLIAGAVGLTTQHFEIPHRSTIRMGWKQKVVSTFKDLEIREFFHRGSITSGEIVIHSSPLVRIFAEREFGCLYDGKDVFVALYLNKKSDVGDNDFNLGYKDLERHMARNEETYQKYVVENIDA